MNKYSSLSDAELLFRIAKRDEAAFETLLSRYEKQIYNLAFYKLKNRFDAEDAVQDAFYKLWRGAGSYRGGSASAFIFTTAKNAVTDVIRRRGEYTVPLTADDGDGEETELPIADDGDTPEESALRGDTVKSVRAAIERLPDHQREVVILYDLIGKSYSEISDTLGIDIGTVKSRLSRGRKNLKKLLSDGNKDE